MHTLDCNRFIREDNPDALVLAILCDFKGRDAQKVIEEIICRLIELTDQQPEKLRNYLKMLETLCTNRNLGKRVQEVETKMLREIDIEKLPSYQIGRGRGLEQCLEQGLEQGLEQVATVAIQQDLSITQIMLLTGLGRERIEALRDKNSKAKG